MNDPSPGDHEPYLRPRSMSLHRSKGLKKLGVSEEDVELAKQLLEQIPTCPSDPNKVERILGYASSRLAREKALRLLGTTEEEVDCENAKMLGSLGVAGRRRSFSVMQHPNQPELLVLARALPRATAISFERHTFVAMKPKAPHRARRKTMVSTSKPDRQRRRSSDTEIRFLRNQARTSEMKMEALKSRIEELEKRLSAQTDQTRVDETATSPALIEADCSRAAP